MCPAPATLVEALRTVHDHCRLDIADFNLLPAEWRRTFPRGQRLVYMHSKWRWAELQKGPAVCACCGARSLSPSFVDYQTTHREDGQTRTVTLPKLNILRCQKCGKIALTTHTVVQALCELLDRATAATVGLLQHRDGWRLDEIAARTGIPVVKLHRIAASETVPSESDTRMLRYLLNGE